MHELARVFFQVDPLNAYPIGSAVIACDLQKTVFAERSFILGNLVALGEIRIKIVFARKPGRPVDPAIKGKPCLNGIFHGLFIKDRQGPGLTCAYRACPVVGRGVITYAASAKEFCGSV